MTVVQKIDASTASLNSIFSVTITDAEQASTTANMPMQEVASPTIATVDPANTLVELFGSFMLGGDEFALPASCIREVVNYPDKITHIPLSPVFLEGIFTLRGNAIPVLNLAKIFDAAAPAADHAQKIAIVDRNQVQIGILFHDTGEILRVRPEQRCQLHYKDPAIHGVIAGIIRLENGSRLLQILDPSALIHIENVPQIRALKSANSEEKNNKFHLQAERRQCVSFTVGHTNFAFEMSAIQEIINVPELKASVLHSKLCIGRINLRGNPVAVVDFASLLNISKGDQPPSVEQRIMIARIGDAAIGLLVDSVNNILSFFSSDVLPIPLLSKARAGMFRGCISKEGIGEVLFLDHQAIFSQAEIADITKGHISLYQQEAAADGTQQNKNAAGDLQRQVYITFSLGHTFAVEIKRIREIIDYSNEILQPPNMPPFVYGVLNLRQQMITVIDLRRFYQMPSTPDMSNAKIFVIEQGNERYGLMVDSVENIITVTNRDRIPTPKVIQGLVAEDIRNEMQEIIDIAGGNDSRQTFSVFDVDIFLARLLREFGG